VGAAASQHAGPERGSLIGAGMTGVSEE
jgi:hypothetical protein